ncbi:uncharacterized protein L201_003762 [Kwoniella dendrophila CBS 6074]|uniref:Zn(2)-C6 fungal-type domain-containing protein n=1 Tax=Kwoniella dendrophila CBS 6074 TaxID=1295534 RepID=A0AAX4JU07_9TREE
MPPKRKATEPDSRENSTQASGGKRTGHTSRACDQCRKRKIRCDGEYPQCGVCKERDCPCEYKDEDKRKTHQEHMEDINNRMDRFERLIEDLLKSTQAGSVPPSQHNSSYNAGLSNNIHEIAPSMEAGTSGGLDIPQEEDVPSWSIPDGPILPMTDIGTSSYKAPSDPGVSPIASTRLKNLGGTSGYERFQRVEEAAGALLQYGPTSLWTCTSPHTQQHDHSPPSLELQSGDYIDWSYNLPSVLNISKMIHDQAMEYFSSFYAPWGMTIDMPAFLIDLNKCNLVRAINQKRPIQTRTASYSPLLHCCILYLGLRLLKTEYPTLMKTYEAIFIQHCVNLLLEECDHTALSSLRALNLYATCVHFTRMSRSENALDQGHRQLATGYLHCGMAIAGVHALGLNINCAEYVSRGLISEKERNLREYAFWTIYISDTLRALAAGRQPMFPDHSEVPCPSIDPFMDDFLWATPSISASGGNVGYGMNGVGVRSLRSTTFHWMARLARICRSILEALYSPASRGSRHEENVEKVSRKLDEWYRQFPLRPAEITPLPHILLLHMYYHLATIFVHRPFYRGHRQGSAERCNQGALNILDLLHTFKRTHQIRFAHHNLINVIFGAATIFLLRIAEPSNEIDNEEHKRNFDQCVDFMTQLSQTWVEAGITRNILVALQSEYQLPTANPNFNSNPIITQNPNPFTNQPSQYGGGVNVPDTTNTTLTVPWVDSLDDMQDIWGMMFNDPGFQWQDFNQNMTRPNDP